MTLCDTTAGIGNYTAGRQRMGRQAQKLKELHRFDLRLDSLSDPVVINNEVGS